MLATTVAVALVIVPVASFVTANVIAALPDTPDSPLAMGGVSLDARSDAENVGFVAAGAVGEVDELLPQPRASDARTTTRTDARAIGDSFG
jgi:hypothetical protein